MIENQEFWAYTPHKHQGKGGEYRPGDIVCERRLSFLRVFWVFPACGGEEGALARARGRGKQERGGKASRGENTSRGSREKVEKRPNTTITLASRPLLRNGCQEGGARAG